MKTIQSVLSRLLADEDGGEVIEYAIVASLIVIGAVTFISTVGTNIKGAWNSIAGSPL